MVYLKTNSDLTGAVMFSFGLLTVVHYGLHLYTGKAGFFERLYKHYVTENGVPTSTSFVDLMLPILIGNAIGCLIMAMLCWESCPDIVTNAQALVGKRLDAGLLVNFLMSIPCGFIMTTAVEFGRNKQFLPLLFGVPLFIVCGFRHSIADAFYYCAAGLWSLNLLWAWLVIVAGNFVGFKVIKVYDDWMSGTGRKKYEFAGWTLIVGRYYIAEHSKTICLNEGDKFILKEVYDKYGR